MRPDHRLLGLFGLLLLATGGEAAAEEAAVAIVGARVFDGETLLPAATVVFERGRIVAVGPEVATPAGARVIGGSGKTLLPGLIDGHVHTWGDALERAAVFGVTTVLDMFTDHRFAAGMRLEQREERTGARADLFSAGTLATAPGGHGTQYGMPIPTLTSASEAEDWVAARLAEGSDYIKIVLEDGSLWGRPIPTVDAATCRALVEAAHRRGKLAVVHVSTQDSAEVALTAGADGLVHLFRDAAADPAWLRRAAERKLFVVPTLTVLESTTGKASGTALVADRRLAPYLRGDEAENLQRSFPARGASMEGPFASIRALRGAGVRVLAGTDAPNPGTSFGASLHRELELLVAAGLTPLEALAAATAVPAAAFGLGDRGRITPGRRADLVLVEGDPTTDILATRAIVAVWKDGREIARPQQAAAPTVGATAAPTAAAPGLISDFEDGAVGARYGAWDRSTDAMMGGKSKVELAVVGGAGGSKHALAADGELAAGAAYPWAGPIFLPGGPSFAPADLSAAKELRLWARADRADTLAAMLFSVNLGMVPAVQRFAVGTEWRQIVLPLSAFPGLDPKTLRGIHISATTPGPFHFEIDDLELK